jgi:hypothetical protein
MHFLLGVVGTLAANNGFVLIIHPSDGACRERIVEMRLFCRDQRPHVQRGYRFFVSFGPFNRLGAFFMLRDGSARPISRWQAPLYRRSHGLKEKSMVNELVMMCRLVNR